MTARKHYLTGRAATRDLWVVPEWEGMAEFGPWLLDDGRQVQQVIAAGQVDELPFAVWFRQDQGSKAQRHGDILWGTGSPAKVVSRRFVEALSDLGVTGLSTYPIEVVDRRRRPIEGDFVGLVEPLAGQGEVCSPYPDQRGFSLVVTGRVLEGLRERGVTEYLVEPYQAPNPGSTLNNF